MPRHLEFIEGCALCLPHGNSAFSVACDLLYKTKISFSLYLCGLNKTFIQREFQLAKLKYLHLYQHVKERRAECRATSSLDCYAEARKFFSAS